MNTTNHTSRSLLAALRALRPPRHLSDDEARSVAERQAALLIKRAGADYPVDVDLLDHLPGLAVQRDRSLPDAVAGSSHWTGTEWLICLNAHHPDERQRFTAFHELHHIIEHPNQRFAGSAAAERLADHFSACVLMPRTLVKHAWASGVQDEHELAQIFAVSDQAMHVRLVKLGLIDGTRHDCRRERRIYDRLSTTPLRMLPANATGGSK